MSRNVVIGCILSSLIMISTNASADNHTVSFGYAQSKIEEFALRGVNAQYRYEWDSPVSIIGSFTYMKGAEKEFIHDSFNSYEEKENIKYYSLLAGPAYRFNDYVSLYAVVGFAHTKLEYNTTDRERYSEQYIYNTNSLAYGAGVVINPVENLSVNIGYEGTHAKYNYNVSVNGFNMGIGYRF